MSAAPLAEAFAPQPPALSVQLEHRAGPLMLSAAFDIQVSRAALFGPSGAGKTTLLRLLAGLDRPSTGRIVLDGQVLVDTATGIFVRPAKRSVGLVMQAVALFPHLSVEENLSFGLRGLTAREQEERLRDMCNRFGLESMRSRHPARLSGGEQQRVALARALVRRPRLLLLDEPFSALDAERKAQQWEALTTYQRESGMATLLVSHDVSEVWSSVETVIRMDAGTAREQGSPEAMLARERARALRQLDSA